MERVRSPDGLEVPSQSTSLVASALQICNPRKKEQQGKEHCYGSWDGAAAELTPDLGCLGKATRAALAKTQIREKKSYKMAS